MTEPCQERGLKPFPPEGGGLDLKRGLSIIDLSLNDITAFLNNIPGGPSSWLHWRAHDGYEFLRARHQSVNLPQLRGFSLFGPNGIQSFASWDKNILGVDISDRPYFLSLKRGAQTESYGPYIGRNTGTYTFSITRRINGLNGDFLGIVFAALEPSYFSNTCKQIRQNRNIDAYIVNSQDIIISGCGDDNVSGHSLRQIIGEDNYTGTLNLIKSSNFYHNKYISIRQPLLSHAGLSYVTLIDTAFHTKRWELMRSNYQNTSYFIVLLIGLTLTIGFYYIIRSANKEESLRVKRAEAWSALNLLDEQSSLLRATVEAIPGGFYYKDSNGRYVGCNQALANIVGVDKSGIIGKTSADIAPADLAVVWFESDCRLIQNGGSEYLETEIMHSSGTRKNVIISKSAYYYGTNNKIGIVGVITDITAHKIRESDLKIAQLRAELANVAKSNLLSNISHELRTPLNAIIGFSNLIEAKIAHDSSNTNVVEFANLIGASGKRLLDLVVDVIDIASIDLDRKPMYKDSIPLSSRYFQNLFNLLQSRADFARLKFTVNMSHHSLHVFAEPKKLKQMIFLIVDNAIKYNKMGGSVLIEIIGEDNGVTIICTDSGIGIPSDMINKVREPFTRVEKGRGKYVEGAGLGLTIVDMLIKRHSGYMQIESEHGIQTKVSLFIPNDDRTA